MNILQKNNFSDFNAEHIIDFLTSNEIINMSDVKEQMNKRTRERYLKHHDNRIWQGKDGRYRTYLVSDSGRKLIAKTSIRDIEDSIVDFYMNQNEFNKPTTIRNLYPEWLEHKKLHTTAPNYIARINSDWKKYYDNTELIDMPLNKLDKIVLDEFVHRMILDNELTKTAYYNCSIILRQSLQYALEKGYIAKNHFPMVKIDSRRMFKKVLKKNDSSQVYTNDERKKLSELAWKEFYDRTLRCELSPLAVLFSFQTGLRIGELSGLRYSDIEPTNQNMIHIQRMVRRETNEVLSHTKTDCGDREIPLTAEAKRIIALAKDRQVMLKCESQYIFSLTEKPLSYYSITRCLKRYCKQIGIEPKLSHKIRKTFVSSLLDQHINLNTVRSIVGHTDERTTLKNYCYDRSTDAEKVLQIEKALKV